MAVCHLAATWIPYNGTGYIVGESVIPPPDCPNAPVPDDFDSHFRRSAMSSSLVVCTGVRRTDLNYDLARRLFAQFKQVVPSHMGEFYHLAEYSLSRSVWTPRQCEVPETGEENG